MRIGTMLKDIVESFFKESATQLYPAVKIPPPERYRGEFSFDPTRCTGCMVRRATACTRLSQRRATTSMDSASEEYGNTPRRQPCAAR